MWLQESHALFKHICQLHCTAAGHCGDPAIKTASEYLLTDRYTSHEVELWERLRAEVAAPLEKEPEADAAKEAQLAVEVADVLAAWPCAYVCCTRIAGASEADTPRGKRCAACETVRYCCRACQVLDWPSHKLACRELKRGAGVM